MNIPYQGEVVFDYLEVCRESQFLTNRQYRPPLKPLSIKHCQARHLMLRAAKGLGQGWVSFLDGNLQRHHHQCGIKLPSIRLLASESAGTRSRSGNR